MVGSVSRGERGGSVCSIEPGKGMIGFGVKGRSGRMKDEGRRMKAELGYRL